MSLLENDPYESIIKKTRPTVDICLTYLGASNNQLRAIKWSILREDGKLIPFRHRADFIYVKMREIGYYLPIIARKPEYLSMKWDEGEYSIAFDIQCNPDLCHCHFQYGKSKNTVTVESTPGNLLQVMETIREYCPLNGGNPLK